MKYKDDVKNRYEMSYWRKVHNEEVPSPLSEYKGLADWFEVRGNSLLEIGAGAFGGLLPMLEAERKVAVDPLYDKLSEEGLLTGILHNIELVPLEFEEYETEEKFEAIISVNSLDHRESDFTALRKIRKMLVPGGRFYLYVHLRTKDQLNVGHDHQMKLADLEKEMEGFVEEKRKVTWKDLDELRLILRKE